MRIGWRTDKPPDEKEEYLVQVEDAYMVVGVWTDVNPIWTDLTTDWHWSRIPQYSNVVAWMPLPEPYKEEQEHEQS